MIVFLGKVGVFTGIAVNLDNFLCIRSVKWRRSLLFAAIEVNLNVYMIMTALLTNAPHPNYFQRPHPLIKAQKFLEQYTLILLLF